MDKISTSTGISIGTMVLILGASFFIIKGQSETKSSLKDMKYELSQQAEQTNNELSKKIDKLDGRMTNFEKNANYVTAFEFLKWAVHLQQLNKDPKKLQSEGLLVPETEQINK